MCEDEHTDGWMGGREERRKGYDCVCFYLVIMNQRMVRVGFVLHGRYASVMVQSITGTGKTGAFGMALLARIDPRSDHLQVHHGRAPLASLASCFLFGLFSPS